MAKKATSKKSPKGKTGASPKTAGKAPKRVASGKAGKAKPRKSAPARKSSSKAAKKASPKAKSTRKHAGGKSPLSKAELKEMRQLLLDKRRSILGDMAGIQNGGALGQDRHSLSGDLSNMPTHPADIGSDNYEQEFSLGLLESERALLEEINEALERIDRGTYGLCLGTGEPIGTPRLRARPWAKHCIEYARMIEKGLAVAKPSGSSPSRDDRDEGTDDDRETDD